MAPMSPHSPFDSDDDGMLRGRKRANRKPLLMGSLRDMGFFLKAICAHLAGALCAGLFGCAGTDVRRLPQPSANVVVPSRTTPSSLGPSVVADPGPTPNPMYIPRVAFIGNQELTRRELRNAMRIEEHFTRSDILAQLDIDLVALRETYWENGYLDVSLRRPEGGLIDRGKFLVVVITVDEGPRYEIGRVVLSELDSQSKPRAPLGTVFHDHLSMKSGFTFQYRSLRNGITAVEHLYRDAGYAEVEHHLDLRPNVDTHKVDLNLWFRRGPLVRVSRVVVLGNKRIPTTAIESVLAVRAGDLSSDTAIERSVDRILALEGARGVHPSFATDPGGTRTLTFEVDEKPEPGAGLPDPPQTATELAQQAEELARQKRYAEERATRVRIARAFPYSAMSSRAQLRIADIDFKLGDPASAAEEYTYWVQLHPNDPEAPRVRTHAEEARRRQPSD